jgi:hypothetical protein
MTRLSETQATILSAAAERPDGNVLPFPPALRGGAAAKVVAALLTRGLIRENTTESSACADTALNPVWRTDAGDRAILFEITDAGRQAIGGRRGWSPERPGAGHTDSIAPAESLTASNAEGPSATHPRPLRAKARKRTKQAQVVAMLRRDKGATIAQIVGATGWRPHYADARIMPR